MLSLEELCALRDKLVMDDSYTENEQIYMYSMLQKEILARR